MTRIQDDLYEAVNEKWLAQAKIPADKPRISAFDELVIENERKLTADLADLLKNPPKDPVLQSAIKFYKKAGDWEARNSGDLSAVKAEFAKISDLKNFDDFLSNLTDLALNSQTPLPFSLSVEPDMMDAIHHSLAFTGPGLILPDTTYYEESHPRKAELLDFYQKNASQILEKLGVDKSSKIAEEAVKFDNLLVSASNTAEEWARYPELYRPEPFEAFAAQLGDFPVSSLVKNLIGKLPEQVIIFESRFYEQFSNLINAENWPLIKSWMLVHVGKAACAYLSDELRVLGGAFSRFLSNVSEARSQEKHQLDVTEQYFNQAIGRYYGQKYFGEEAKKDVERMVSAMIKVYQERLLANTWLSKETIAQAIEKLDAITPFIGYPSKLPRIYDKLIVGDHSTLYEDAVKFDQILTVRHYEKYSEAVDKTEWHMPAHMVNAYYSPDSNTIVFPAAILQAPFYSLEQTSSQNYGGIGAVIAHEISHAFDNNGSQFDKYGNLNNWWTEKDYEAFEQKTQEMIVQFDGLKMEAGVVNGQLIVSENIADQGGITAALEATKKEEESDLLAFFTQWATVWRMKASQEFQQMLLSSDVHAPAKLRANIPPTNLDEFFEALDIKETDKMYRAPEDRLKIW